jgi:hypothetical protein
MAGWKGGAHKYGMGELMPANGKEFERGDYQSYAGDGPQTKKYDRIDDYLPIRLEHTKMEMRKGWMGDPLRRAQPTEREREIQEGRRKDGMYLAPGHV